MSRIICLTGPSGVGKTSYSNRLAKHCGYVLPRVVTTRNPRADDDARYQYVSAQEFLALEDSGVLLETDRYMDYYYGTLRVDVFLAGSRNQSIVLDLTPNGVRKVVKQVPDALVLILMPDDPNWLARRLRDRNTQSEQEIENRVSILWQYMSDLKTLKGIVIFVGYEPATWDSTFQEILRLTGNVT